MTNQLLALAVLLFSAFPGLAKTKEKSNMQSHAALEHATNATKSMRGVGL
jgi:hypothetical protein